MGSFRFLQGLAVTGLAIGSFAVLACTTTAMPAIASQCSANAECDAILKVPAGSAWCSSGVCQMRAAVSDGGAANEAGVAVDAASPLDASDAALISPQEKAFCDAVVSHGTCPDQTPGACDVWDKCVAGLMTATAVTAFAQCYGAPSCLGQDKCLIAAGKAEGGAAASKYVTDCQARYNSCEGAFNQSNCSAAAYAFPGVGDGMSACLAQDCDKVEACMKVAAQKVIACK